MPESAAQTASITSATFAQDTEDTLSSGRLAPPGNTIELVHLSAQSFPRPKWQMDRFSRFCTAHGRKCLYLTMGAPIHQNCPFPWESEPSCNTWFLGSMRAHNLNGTSICSAVFAQMTAKCPYTLQWFAHFPLKIALLIGDLDSHVIHGSLGQLESSTPTAFRSLLPFLQGSLVWETDRPTDHATRSVTTGRMYVRSTAMRRNNA